MLKMRIREGYGDTEASGRRMTFTRAVFDQSQVSKSENAELQVSTGPLVLGFENE